MQVPYETTLEEILNEPIIQQVMARDGVRSDDIVRLLRRARMRSVRRMCGRMSYPID